MRDTAKYSLLILGFGAIITLMILLGLVSLQKADTLAELTGKLYRHPLTVSNAVLEANSKIIAMHRYMKDVVLARNAEDLRQASRNVDENERRVYQDFDIIMARFLGDKSRIIETRKAFSDWKAIRLEVIELTRAGKYDEAARITKGKGAEHVLLLTTKMDGLIDFARNKAAEFMDDSDREHERIRTFLYAMLSALVLISCAIATLVLFSFLRFERQRHQADKALRENEQNFRSAFENVMVGCVVISDKGIIEIFNSAAEEIFGYPADEVIGQNVSLLMPEPHRGRHDGYLQKYLQTGEAQIIDIGREVNGLRKNGEEFRMYLGVGKMQVGAKISFVGSIHDLTKMKTLEAQLAQSQKMEVVGHLAGGVAHDFNNLLSVMIGNADLIKRKFKGDEQSDRYIDAILRAGSRGASLTRRLLAFSRQQVLSPRPTATKDLILGLEDLIHRTLGETIEVQPHFEPETWEALIDPPQLESALMNLAINARDAMPGGGILSFETTNITLDESYAEQHEEVTPGDYVKVAVSDTGTGMTPEVLKNVYEPFFTTREVGEGSGLGLSMVYGFVKQSNGHITIESKVGDGTTVSLYLPRSEDTSDHEMKKHEEPEFSHGSECILVVEDDEDVREISTTLLRDQGYRVIEAENGNEAIKFLENDQPIDLLFTDVVLPGGMSGPDIAEQARRTRPNIKVIFTSGYAEHAAVDKAKLAPGVIMVNKPYDRAELLEKVRLMLDSVQD